jgi:hypothetical protein
MLELSGNNAYCSIRIPYHMYDELHTSVLMNAFTSQTLAPWLIQTPRCLLA